MGKASLRDHLPSGNGLPHAEAAEDGAGPTHDETIRAGGRWGAILRRPVAIAREVEVQASKGCTTVVTLLLVRTAAVGVEGRRVRHDRKQPHQKEHSTRHVLVAFPHCLTKLTA